MPDDEPLSWEPFEVRVSDAAIADLRDRLARTCWPTRSPVPGWNQGVPLEVMQKLVAYWAEDYDWRATQTRLNAVPQQLVDVDGVRIHLLHARSRHEHAMPLVLTHGWPGSVLEMLPLVEALVDPERHGGTSEDAFHVVMPSLPGYGFSSAPAEPGWGVQRIAAAWARLMAGLGYSRYGAAGSDWGTSVSSALALADPDHVAGVHLVPPLAGPGDMSSAEFTDEERRSLHELKERGRSGSAYSEVHRTVPQTVGYALVDSPVGLCAWMADKLLRWTDPHTRHPAGEVGPTDAGLTFDQVLDQVSLYWFTGTAASSAQLYAESIDDVSDWISGRATQPVLVPVGASIFPAEVPRPSRRWAQRRYPDIRYWKEHDRGGHFAALEVPDLLVADLRAFFRTVG